MRALSKQRFHFYILPPVCETSNDLLIEFVQLLDLQINGNLGFQRKNIKSTLCPALLQKQMSTALMQSEFPVPIDLAGARHL